MPPKRTTVPKDSQEELRPPRPSFAQRFNPNIIFPGISSRGRTANPPGQSRASNLGRTRGNLEPSNSPSQPAPQQPRTGLDTATSDSPNEYVPRLSFGDEFTVGTVHLERRPQEDATQPPGHSAAGKTREIPRKPLPNVGPSQHVSGQLNPSVYPTIAGPSSQQVGGYGTGAARDAPRNLGGQTNPAADSDTEDTGFRPPHARRIRARQSARGGAQRQSSGGEGTRSVAEYSAASSATRPSGQYPSAGPSSQHQPSSGCGTRSVAEYSAAFAATRPSRQSPSARRGAQRQPAGAFDLDSSDEYSDGIPGEDPFEGPASMRTVPQRRATLETVEIPVFGQTAIVQERPSPRGRFLTSPTAVSQRVGGQRAISTTEAASGQGGGQRVASTTVVPSGRSTTDRLVPLNDVRNLHAKSGYSGAVSLPKDDSEMPREYPEGGYRHEDVSTDEDGSKGYKR